MPPKNRGRGKGKGRGRGRGKSPTKRSDSNPISFDSGWSNPRVPDKPIVIDECDEVMETPLTKFMNITGAEQSVAKNYLTMCEDLNEAIALFCQCAGSDNVDPLSSTVNSGRDENFDAPCALPSEVLSPNTYQKT